MPVEGCSTPTVASEFLLSGGGPPTTTGRRTRTQCRSRLAQPIYSFLPILASDQMDDEESQQERIDAFSAALSPVLTRNRSTTTRLV